MPPLRKRSGLHDKFTSLSAYRTGKGGSHTGKVTPQLLKQEGDGIPTKEFLSEYEKAVLLSLEKAGILTQPQLEECKARLEET